MDEGCTDCPTGSASATGEKCTDCPDGYVSRNEGSAYCDLCGVGSHSNVDHTECLVCPRNTYKPPGCVGRACANVTGFINGRPGGVVGFSRAVRVGNFIAVGGTAPVDAEGKTVGVGDVF